MKLFYFAWAMKSLCFGAGLGFILGLFLGLVVGYSDSWQTMVGL